MNINWSKTFTYTGMLSIFINTVLLTCRLLGYDVQETPEDFLWGICFCLMGDHIDLEERLANLENNQ